MRRIVIRYIGYMYSACAGITKLMRVHSHSVRHVHGLLVSSLHGSSLMLFIRFGSACFFLVSSDRRSQSLSSTTPCAQARLGTLARPRSRRNGRSGGGLGKGHVEFHSPAVRYACGSLRLLVLTLFSNPFFVERQIRIRKKRRLEIPSVETGEGGWRRSPARR
jgi:hypothetical protein